MNVRPISEDDLAAVVRVAAEDESVIFGRASRIGEADVRGWLSRVNLEADSWLYDDGNAFVALAWFEHIDDLGISVGIVAQGAKGRGLGCRIVENGERRARELGLARLQTFALEPDTAAAELFTGQGFEYVRRFYEMAIELETAPPAPLLPDGCTLEGFHADDARPFYEALDSAFADHWEHHSLGFERWWDEKRGAHDFDPTLWFLVRAGDEVAAVVRNDPERSGGGYVGALGVTRPWRGKGLGRALLLRTFGEFYSRGVRRVTLGVDAESPTGATKLYESVGMTIENAAVVYEKALA